MQIRQYVWWGFLVLLLIGLAILLFPTDLVEKTYSRAVSVAPAGGSNARNIGGANDPAFQNDARAAQPGLTRTQPAAGEPQRKFALRSDVRKLALSNTMTGVDYALSRASLNCMSIGYGTEAYVKASAEKLDAMQRAGRLDVGNATVAQRLSSRGRSEVACREYFSVGPLSDAEMAQVRATSAFEERARIKRVLVGQQASNEEFQAALKLAVSAPMFSVVDEVLSNNLDVRPLEQAYSLPQREAWSFLASMVIVCRMGDDCGPGGIVTEQLCWNAGICGQTVEEAVTNHISGRGLDASIFLRFVGTTYSSLQSGGFANLRRRAA